MYYIEHTESLQKLCLTASSDKARSQINKTPKVQAIYCSTAIWRLLGPFFWVYLIFVPWLSDLLYCNLSTTKTFLGVPDLCLLI